MKRVVVIFAAVYIGYSAEISPRPAHPALAKWKHTSRIVGGQEAEPHSIPYQVGLYLGGAFCGGSLISVRWVLTAAHCGEITKTPQVILGAHRVQSSESTQVIVTGIKVLLHESWDKNTLVNDIALILLAQAAPINEYIATVPLAPIGADYTGRTAIASGWGLASDVAESISPVLRKTTSVILTNKECFVQFNGVIDVWDELVCLDGSRGKSTCNGDSGGPLTVEGVQVGLTSFGVNVGCEKGYPAAFTRVSSYRMWIQNKTSL